MRRIQRTQTLTTTGDNTLISALPKRFKGNLIRLHLTTRAAAACTFRFKETFTPDASAGTPSPTAVTRERYVAIVSAGASVDLDGRPLAVFLYSLAVNVDQQPVDVSYVLELE